MGEKSITGNIFNYTQYRIIFYAFHYITIHSFYSFTENIQSNKQRTTNDVTDLRAPPVIWLKTAKQPRWQNHYEARRFNKTFVLWEMKQKTTSRGDFPSRDIALLFYEGAKPARMSAYETDCVQILFQFSASWKLPKWGEGKQLSKKHIRKGRKESFQKRLSDTKSNIFASFT